MLLPPSPQSMGYMFCVYIEHRFFSNANSATAAPHATGREPQWLAATLLYVYFVVVLQLIRYITKRLCRVADRVALGPVSMEVFGHFMLEGFYYTFYRYLAAAVRHACC